MLKIEKPIITGEKLEKIVSIPAPKIKKRGVFRVEKGEEDSLICFRKNLQKKNSALRIILKNDQDGYENVRIGEFWHITYYETTDKSFAWGVAEERAQLVACRKVTTEGKTNVGMILYLEELGHEKGLIFTMTFPRDRKMSQHRIDLINKKLKNFKNTAYKEEVLMSYSQLLDHLVDDERQYQELEKELEVQLKNLSLPENTENFACDTLENVVEMILENVNPLDPSSFPTNISEFITASISEYSILGIETFTRERVSRNNMKIKYEVHKVVFQIPNSEQKSSLIEITEKEEEVVVEEEEINQKITSQ
jgi:hypothetical protein